MGENEKKEGTQPKYEEGALKIHKLTQAEVVFSVVGCGIVRDAWGRHIRPDWPVFRYWYSGSSLPVS